MFKTLLASAAIALLPLGVMADTAETATNKATAIEALGATLGALNADAVDQYFGPEYIQHNDMVPDGVDGLKGLIGMLKGNDGFKADVVRVIADGDLVAFHSRYEGFGPDPLIAFDVFRLEDGKIVEHWDNLTPETAPNPSGRTQIDGTTEITDLDKTEANKALVEEFITRRLINREDLDMTRFINPDMYLQHNSNVADGLEGLREYRKKRMADGAKMRFTTLHKVIGEGNFVLTMSEGVLGEDAKAFYDLFRLQDGLIVEHWDVIAPMPGDDAKHNESGKF